MRKNGAAPVQSRRTEGSDTRQVRCLTMCARLSAASIWALCMMAIRA